MEEQNNIYDLEDRNYRLAILSAIRGDNTDDMLREILADYHDNDIAAVMEELSAEETSRNVVRSATKTSNSNRSITSSIGSSITMIKR